MTPTADNETGARAKVESLKERVWRVARDEVRLLRPRRMLAAAIASALPQLTFNFTRTRILRAGGLKIGERTLVMGPLHITGQADVSQCFSIGADSVITGPLTVDLGAPVHIGKGVRIGHQVLLLTVDHQFGPASQRCGPSEAAPVTIGDGAWIGSRVTVLPGVTVGAGAVVAAGSVVTRDVPPNTLVAGVPARPMRDLEEVAAPGYRERTQRYLRTAES